MKLVIDRSKWLRGEGSGELLRRDDRKMCCLGFYALQSSAGLGEDDILGLSTPDDVADRKKAIPPNHDWLITKDEDDESFHYFKSSAACNRLTQANDSESLTDAVREAQIIAEFAKHGVEVEFVN